MDPLLASPSGFSPEFVLSARCAAPPGSLCGLDDADTIPPSLNWPLFLHLVRRHRVAGLIARASAGNRPDCIPQDVWDQLQQEWKAGARLSFRLAAESTRLAARLAEASVAVIFLKGAALAHLIYGDVACRHSKDIDLLVPPRQLERSLAVLSACGYQPEFPSTLTGPQWAWLLRYGQEVSLRHATTGLCVELHWRKCENPHLMPPQIDSRTLISLGAGVPLPSLERDDLFLFLCVHGARHAWFRLKWLVDIAWMVRDEDDSGLERLFQSARDQGLIRPVAQAMLLTSSLLGIRLPPGTRESWSADPVIRRLVTTAARSLALVNDPSTSRYADTRIRLSHYLLRPEMRYVVAELAYDLISHEDWQSITLPAKLTFLYPFLRLPLWLWRKIRPRPRAEKKQPTPPPGTDRSDHAA